MRLSVLTGLLLALALSACSSTPAPHSAAPANDAASCAEQGGQWRALGRLQREQCVVPYADAGKTCSSKSDCTGQCLGSGGVEIGTPATGTCQRDVSETFGCRQRIDGGVAQGTLCVD